MCYTDNKKCLVMLTDSVLLASAWDNNITKKEDGEIKDALFLKTVHRKSERHSPLFQQPTNLTLMLITMFQDLPEVIQVFAKISQYLSSTCDDFNY